MDNFHVEKFEMHLIRMVSQTTILKNGQHGFWFRSTAVEWIIGTHTGHHKCEHPRLVTGVMDMSIVGVPMIQDFFPTCMAVF